MNTFLQPSARKISIFFQCVPNRGVIQVVFFLNNIEDIHHIYNS